MIRLLYFVGFMAIGTLGFYLLLVQEPVSLTGPGRGVSRGPTNVLSMRDVVIHDRQGNQLTWELQANRAEFDESSKVGRLFGVRFTVYRTKGADAGDILFSGRSGQAVLRGPQSLLVLEQGVRLFKGMDTEIRSERIEYDEARGEVRSPGPVWVHTPELTQEGQSLTYNIPDERMTFTSPRFYQ